MMEDDTKPPGKPKRGKMGRPKVDIGLAHFQKLCMYQFTEEELAAALKVSLRTIKHRLAEPEFREAWDRGRADGKVRVRRRGFELMALNNSAGVQAWIQHTKFILGWTEKSFVELTGRGGGPIQTLDLTKATDEQLAALEAIFGPLAAAASDDGGDPGGEGETGPTAGA